MSLYPTAPQSIGKVLDSGFSMFRAVLKPMLPLSFAAAFIAQLPGLLPYVLGRTLAPAGGLPSFAGIGAGIIIFFVVWFVAYIAFYAGWMKSLDALAKGGAVLSFGGAFTAGLPKVLPMVGATICFTLAVCIGTPRPIFDSGNA